MAENKIESWCAECPWRSRNICAILIEEAGLPEVPLKLRHETIRMRRNIYRANEAYDFVAVIREGWAFQFMLLADGRRQILSVLLPGDLVSPLVIGRDRVSFSVQSLTPVRYCAFERTTLWDFIWMKQRRREKLFNIAFADREEANQRIVDLGRCSAQERLAGFLLALVRRMAERGLMQEQGFPLPLKQHHLADALGLTPVHVSRIMNRFRKEGLIEMSVGAIRITDPKSLSEIANVGMGLAR